MKLTLKYAMTALVAAGLLVTAGGVCVARDGRTEPAAMEEQGGAMLMRCTRGESAECDAEAMVAATMSADSWTQAAAGAKEVRAMTRAAEPNMSADTTTTKVKGAKQAGKKQKLTVQEHRTAMMEFFVEGGDTVYVGKSLPAARIYGRIGKQKGKDWRQYYKLVYNFSKVYPYAKEAKGILENVDSTLTAEGWKRGKKEKYIDEMVKRLFDAYEEPLRGVTISQGALLIRLINRETGITPYNIIKDYKNGIAAGFWQGVGKIYSINLKDPYDPNGMDTETEELVILWEIGEFSAVYYSLFGEYPVIPEVEKGFGRHNGSSD